MESKTIIVLDPTCEIRSKQNIAAPRSKKSAGPGKIGFLWNAKPNGDILLSIIKEKLSTKFGLTSTKWYQKESPSSAAGMALLSDMAADSDLVITAIAD